MAVAASLHSLPCLGRQGGSPTGGREDGLALGWSRGTNLPLRGRVCVGFETLSAPGVGGYSGGRSAGVGLPGEWVGPWFLAAVALPREHPCPGLGGLCVG